MRRAVLVVLVAAGAAGCATVRAAGIRSTEQMLSTAGFHVTLADTPETIAQLQSLPPRRIAVRTSQGRTSYVYADPDVCTCLYVGGEVEYREYQRLRFEKDAADERAIDTRGDWTPWPWWQ
jgi:hypothetical protein